MFAWSEAHREAALIPFVFGAPGRRVGLELNAVVRVGPALAPLNPYPALACLKAHAEGHQVSVGTARDPTEPVLDRLRGCALVVGTDPRFSNAFVHACPALMASPPTVHQLELCRDDRDEPVAIDTFARDWRIDAGYDPRRGPPEALRLCAWLVAALEVPLPGGRTALDHVLATHRRPVSPSPRAPAPDPLH